MNNIRKTKVWLLSFAMLVLSGCSGGGSSSSSTGSSSVASSNLDLKATAGFKQVSLEWEGSATSYRVHRALADFVGDDAAAYKDLAGYSSTDTNSNALVIDGLSNEAVYYFVVTKLTDGVESGFSNRVSATPTFAAPSGFSAVGGDEKVTLSWNTSSTSSIYRVHQSTSSFASVKKEDFATVAGYNSTDTQSNSIVINGLSNGILYYFVVTEVRDGEQSLVSDEISIAPSVAGGSGTVNLARPQNVSVTAGVESALLTWSAAEDSTYKIYWAGTSLAGISDPVNLSSYSSTETGSNQYTLSGLSAGVLYYFVITRFSNMEESAPSDEVSVRPEAVFRDAAFSAGSIVKVKSHPTSGVKTFAIGSAAGISQLYRYEDNVITVDKLLMTRTEGIHGVAFHPEGTKLALGDIGANTEIRNAVTGKELIHKHVGQALWDLAFSPDGTQLAIGFNGRKEIHIVNPDGDTLTTTFSLASSLSTVFSLMFNADGTKLLAGGHYSSLTQTNKGGIHVWDVADKKILVEIKDITPPVDSVSFSPDETKIVSGSRDGSVRIWSSTSGEQLLKIDMSTSTADVESVIFSADGSKIVSASSDKLVGVWSSTSGDSLQQFDADIHSLALSADGKELIGVGPSGIKIWNMHGTDNKITEIMKKGNGHTGAIYTTAFSPNGRKIASGGEDSTLRIWNTSGGIEEQTLQHGGVVHSVSFSPDNMHVVSGGADSTLKVWSSTNGTMVFASTHTGYVNAVSFSPNGSKVVSASDDKSVRVWSSTSGVELLNITSHTGEVYAVAFSPDGTKLISGGTDSVVRVWSSTSGTELTAMQKDISGGTIMKVRFINDNEVVAVVRSHSEITSLEEPPSFVEAWNFSTGDTLWKRDHIHLKEFLSSNEADVGVSPDGTKIVHTVGGDLTAIPKTQVMDANGNLILNLRGKISFGPTSIAFSPDSKAFVTGDQNGVLRMWLLP